MHRYTFNGLIDIPAFGKYASGGRATVNGDISLPQPITEGQLKAVIVNEKAKQLGCDAAGITFVDFTYTKLPA